MYVDEIKNDSDSDSNSPSSSPPSSPGVVDRSASPCLLFTEPGVTVCACIRFACVIRSG